MKKLILFMAVCLMSMAANAQDLEQTEKIKV